jgi:SGNH domain (fused to AT3 domains)
VIQSVHRRFIAFAAGALLLISTSPATSLAQTSDAVTPPPDALSIAVSLGNLLRLGIATVEERPLVPAGQPNAVPLNLVPPLSIAATTKARSYSDGCHASQKARKASGCAYGVTSSPVTVAILGDSHGSMWLPAIERIAAERGWRIFLLTKSACPPPNVRVIVKRKPYTACDEWRASALKVIKRLKPQLVIATSAADYRLVGVDGTDSDAYFDAWREGLTDTLRKLERSADQVLVLNDVPKFTQDPVACLEQHPDDVTACTTARDVAVRPRMTEVTKQAAEDAGALFADPSQLVCPGDPCQVVDGRYLQVYDTSHVTPAYSLVVEDGLAALLPEIPAP